MGESADRFSAALDDLIDRTRRACDEGTYEAARHIASQARVNAPHWSGHLATSIKASPPKPQGDDIYTSTIEAGAVYALMQERGGVVTPKHFTFMRIRTGDGRPRDPGHDVFGRAFTIPAHPYFEPAFDESHEEVQQIYVEHYTEAFGA